MSFNFSSGEDQLYLLSVGTGMCKQPIRPDVIQNQSMLAHTKKSFHLLMNSVAIHEDMLCRILGKCLSGDMIDSELGNLSGSGPLEKQFIYTRYNPIFTSKEIESPKGKPHLLEMDNLNVIPFLIESGQRYAELTVNRKIQR